MADTRSRWIIPSLAVLAAAGVLGACGEDDEPTPPGNIVEVAQATPELSTLVTAVVAGDLDGTLSGPGPFTVFAPVNSAFAALPAGVQDELLEAGNQPILQKLLTYHVVPGRLRAANLTEGQTLTSVEGTTLTITLAGGAKVNGVNIIATDVEASNGVVHLIDGVLTESLDIVDVATVRGFSSLVDAVEAAGLTAALRGNGSGGGLTVFAPTNAAFAALPPPLPTGAALANVLTYHVYDGRAAASSLSNGQIITTLQGGSLEVLLAPPSVRLEGNTNTVNVIATDVAAKNGIIHVIDAVLIP